MHKLVLPNHGERSRDRDHLRTGRTDADLHERGW